LLGKNQASFNELLQVIKIERTRNYIKSVLETAHATPIKPKSRVYTRRYVIAK
jgi:hypothetical protein